MQKASSCMGGGVGMNPFVAAVLIAAWLYVLRVLRKAKLYAWRFLWGSLGLFLLLFYGVRPWLWEPLARSVSAVAGVVGSLTGTFETYFKYGMIYIPASTGSITLLVDFECSGIVEIMAFLSLLAFFAVYSFSEKLVVGVAGSAYIILCNALRIVIICLSVHLWGMQAYYIVHAFVGRIIFYILSILLYFYVFTKPQVIQMKVGNFTYGHHQTNT
jgi:exosortase family protein XrtG